MRRAPGGGAGAALLALLAACGPRSSADPRDLMAGAELCYAIEPNRAAQAMGLPWGFALSGSVVPGSDVRVAETLSPEGRRSESTFSYWRMSGDSLELGSRTMGPVSLTLGGGGDRLEGRARATGDVLRPGDPPRPEASGIVAALIRCPEP